MRTPSCASELRRKIGLLHLINGSRHLDSATDRSSRNRAPLRLDSEGYALPLVESMRGDGYDLQLGAHLGQALIGPDGQLHKAKHGDHRFFVARLVGAERFPLQIVGAHKAWVQVAGLDARLQHSDHLAQAVREVERRHR